ncbi:MAG: MopE-related protein [Myxococcota bacterium]
MRSVSYLVFAAFALTACGDDIVDTFNTDTTDDTDAIVDQDGDGFTSDRDCDDDNPDVNPGQAEQCNEIDDNCDDIIDEGFDRDGDGHYSQRSCAYGDDCDDRNAGVSPSADELPYNRIDEDCTGEDLTDVDGDGFDAVEADGDDCDDDDVAINPDAVEIAYDGIDQDCVGGDLIDVDMDGHDAEDFGGDDCDDNDPTTNPSRMDWANDTLDQDCDGRDGADASVRLARSKNILTGTALQDEIVGREMMLCDWDGDSVQDLFISAPFEGTNQGKVGVFLADYADDWKEEMVMDDSDVKMVGNGQNAFFGMGMACGDVDGDGRDDVIIAKGEAYTTRVNSDFKLLVYYGDDDWSWSFDERRFDASWSADFVTSAGSGQVRVPSISVGDLDGDGKAEIALGFDDTWPGIDNDTVIILEGRRHVGDDRLIEEAVSTLTMSDPVADGLRTGLNVSILPDMNGDTYNDLYIGQPFYQTNTDFGSDDPVLEGRALFLSNVEGDGTFEANAYASFLGDPDQRIGFSAMAADVDGSGTADLLISAPFDSTTVEDGGAVYVLLDPALSDTGVSLTEAASARLGEDKAGARMGITMLPSSDVDLDGKADFYIRADNFDADLNSTSDQLYVVSGALASAEDTDISDAYLITFLKEFDGVGTGRSAAVGDVTGDGAPDFFFGAPSYQTEDWRSTYTSGRAYFYNSADYEWGYTTGIE